MGLKRVMLVAGVSQRLLGKVAIVTGAYPDPVQAQWTDAVLHPMCIYMHPTAASGSGSLQPPRFNHPT